MWVPCSPVEAQPLWLAIMQPYGVYPWQAHLLPGDGLQPTPGVQQVAFPSTASSKGLPYASHSAVSQPFHLYGGHTAQGS